MSTRGTILDNLQTQLAAIATGSGYYYSLSAAQVMREAWHQEQLPERKPYVTIIDSGPDRLRQRCASGVIRSEMTVNLILQIQAEDSENPATTEVNNMIADMYQFVETPPSLGSNVLYAAIGEIPAVWIGKDIAHAVVPLTIGYYFDSTNP